MCVGFIFKYNSSKTTIRLISSHGETNALNHPESLIRTVDSWQLTADWARLALCCGFADRRSDCCLSFSWKGLIFYECWFNSSLLAARFYLLHSGNIGSCRWFRYILFSAYTFWWKKKKLIRRWNHISPENNTVSRYLLTMTTSEKHW